MNRQEIRAKFYNRNPSVIHELQFFADSHLNGKPQEVTTSLREQAFSFVEEFKDGPELVKGLRKLLEAKDCLVRHSLVAPSLKRNAEQNLSEQTN